MITVKINQQFKVEVLGFRWRLFGKPAVVLRVTGPGMDKEVVATAGVTVTADQEYSHRLTPPPGVKVEVSGTNPNERFYPCRGGL